MRLAMLTAALAAMLCLTGMAAVQQQQQQPGQAQDKNKKKSDKDKDKDKGNAAKPAAANDKPQPLFGGSLNLKSSRQSKDTATLGFNGLDPNGQVQKAALTSPAGPGDTLKAADVSRYHVDASDLSAFLQDGKLNPQAAPKQASGPATKQ
jgi:hypothetical protein